MLFFLILDDFLVKKTFCYFFLKDRIVFFCLFLNALGLVFFFQIIKELAFHQGLIFCRDFLWRDTIHTVSIVPDPNQKRAQQNTHIKAIALLPLGHIGRRGYAFGELIRRIKFLILYKLIQPFGTFLIIVQLQKPKLRGPDCRTNELINITLIFWIQEQFAILSDMLLELFLELYDMLKDQLLLWCVFSVANGWSRMFELSASL